MSFESRWIVGCISLCLGLACSSSKKIQTGGECLLNSDCTSPLSCSFGKCHVTCQETRDCPLGQSCVQTPGGGVCQLPAEADCRTARCSVGLVCAVDYRCRAACQTAGECTSGQLCVGAVCADSTELDTTTGQLPVKNPAWFDGGAVAGYDGGIDVGLGLGGAGGAGGGLDGALGDLAGAGGAAPTGGTGGIRDAGITELDARGSAGASGGATGGSPDAGGGGSSSQGGSAGSGGSTSKADGGGAGGAPDASLSPGSIWYVNQASPGGDGRSWGTAFTTLQAALTNSALRSGDQIWIAQGTYTPAASGGSRTTYFHLMTGVALYGGFHGTESTLAARDNPVDPGLTVLSGDLEGNDGFDTKGAPTNRDDNSYHVVISANAAVLDGLTISGGNANGSTAEQQQGGGMYNQLCDGLRIAHVRFVSNLAKGSGGGLYNVAGSYKTEELVDVVFAKNQAGSDGGGLFNTSGNARLSDVVFASNQATKYGGGMSTSAGDPVLIRTMFVSNRVSSMGSGGGGLSIGGGSPSLANVSFGGNLATGGNNVDPSYGGGLSIHGGDPMLTDVVIMGNISGGSYGHSGGVTLISGNPVLVNVTLSGNAASAHAGGIRRVGGSPKISNTVIWGNYVGSSIGEVSCTGCTFSHSNVGTCGGSSAWSTSCGTDGGGNIDTDTSPFASYRAPSGSWTETPAYSASTLQTTFTNALAPWVPGELVGMFVQPDGSQPVRLPIVANTATTLTVWGDAVSTAANGTMYTIHDLRLATGSECINTGDTSAVPTDSCDVDGDGDTTETTPWDLDGHPRVVGGIVDMGAFEHQGS